MKKESITADQIIDGLIRLYESNVLPNLDEVRNFRSNERIWMQLVQNILNYEKDVSKHRKDERTLRNYIPKCVTTFDKKRNYVVSKINKYIERINMQPRPSNSVNNAQEHVDSKKEEDKNYVKIEILKKHDNKFFEMQNEEIHTERKPLILLNNTEEIVNVKAKVPCSPKNNTNEVVLGKKRDLKTLCEVTKSKKLKMENSTTFLCNNTQENLNCEEEIDSFSENIADEITIEDVSSEVQKPKNSKIENSKTFLPKNVLKNLNYKEEVDSLSENSADECVAEDFSNECT